MKTVVLDGMYNDNEISEYLKDVFSDDADLSYYSLREKNILACKSCGICGHKTPGECFADDDMPAILKSIANCDLIVMLTSLTFGGYSSVLKKAVDKFMVLGEAMYIVRKGHVLHPMRYGKKKLVVFAVEDKEDISQRESFSKLVENNALNMQFNANTAFISQAEYKNIIRGSIERAVSVAKS